MSGVQRTGRAAAGAGILMILGVEGEWLLDPQRDDGTVTNMPVFAVLLLIATIGFALLFVAVRGLRTRTAATKPARVGAVLSLVGAGLLVAFGAMALLTAITTGSPLEASFIAFLVGLLLLSVGPVIWGVSLRRHSPPKGVWQLLVLSGVAAFCALAIEPDPWHDISLVGSFAAWTMIGVLLLRGADRSASERAGRTAQQA